MKAETARMAEPSTMTRAIGLMRPPPSVLFGDGALQEVPALAASFGARVVICTDSILAASVGTRELVGGCREEGLEVTVLDAAVAELPLATVEEAIAAARTLRPDVIVAFGGGSCIDLAKLLSLGLVVDAPLSDFYGEAVVAARTLPVVAVPTTAGTGSEVTPVAVLSDPSRGLKVGISSTALIPRAAVCDPVVTLGAPPTVTAYAGIDALAHAIEAYTAVGRTWGEARGRIAVGKNALSDTFALRAISRLARSLPDAVEDDLDARRRALEGSLYAGLAFASAGVSAAHALQYPVGARTKTPHGLGVGMLLPYCMRFNLSVRREAFGDIAEALGLRRDPEAAVEYVAELAASVGFPRSLAELGLDRSEIDEIATQAVTIERLIANNPRPISKDDAIRLLDAAWCGDLTLVDDRR